jgi:DNA-binding transcriptional MerR regulator
MAQPTAAAGGAGRRNGVVEQGRLGVEATSPNGAAGATGVTEWDEVGYGGPQVCKIVGISYRQLDYWARTDLVRPSLADAKGSGTQRRYSYRDLVRLKVVKNLLDAGVKLATARKAIEYLTDDLGESLETASIVLDGVNSILARTGDDLVDLVRRGQGVLNIVPLGSVVHEIDASIHELAPDARAERDVPRAARVAQGG